MSALRRFAVAASLVLLTALVAVPALADDLSDFERARASYDAQRYGEAVERLELLVGGEPPRISARAILLEARKYLAASYLFVARRADAERQFTLLLGDDPQYQLDPTTFPSEVRAVFASVRTRLEREARDRAVVQAREEAARRAEEAARIQRERDRLTHLTELALTETTIEQRSRWIAAIPFGIGQFQNGHTGVGIAFAVSEGVLAATSIAMRLLYDALPNPATFSNPLSEPLPTDFAEVRRLEAAYSMTNYIATGLLAAVIVVGIVDAEVRFVPTVTRTRRRSVPDALPAPTPSTTLGLGPGGATFQLRF